VVAVQGGLIAPLTRRFGVRSVGAAGGLLMGLGLTSVAVSPSLTLAVLALGVLAAGQGLCVPSHSTLISQMADTAEQGSILGARQSCGAAARALGPVVAGALYDLHMSYPYLLGGFLAVVAGLLIVRIATLEPKGDRR